MRLEKGGGRYRIVSNSTKVSFANYPLSLSRCRGVPRYHYLAKGFEMKSVGHFHDMVTCHSDVEGVLECTVIGACFILTCNLGRQTATDNLRPLPNFAIPIQVATHREAVLAAAQ